MPFRMCLLVSVLMLAACGSSSGPATSPSVTTTSTTLATTVTINIPAGDYDYVSGKTQAVFSPASVELAVGGSIIWVNNDAVTHTSTSNTNVWTNNIAAGGRFTRVFGTTGTFDYKCTIHPSMMGTISVK